jgi:hypothetical protein
MATVRCTLCDAEIALPEGRAPICGRCADERNFLFQSLLEAMARAKGVADAPVLRKRSDAELTEASSRLFGFLDRKAHRMTLARSA